MHVFVTGTTGWIGSAVVAELLEAGHDVTGLARSEQSAAKLHERGIEVVRGTLEDLDSLKTAAAGADGVIHTAYNHDDFNRFAEAATLNQRAIEAFAKVLEGADKPLVFSSGTGLGKPGQLATETDLPPKDAHPRAASEYARVEMAAKGIRVSSVRHPRGRSAYRRRVSSRARRRLTSDSLPCSSRSTCRRQASSPARRTTGTRRTPGYSTT